MFLLDGPKSAATLGELTGCDKNTTRLYIRYALEADLIRKGALVPRKTRPAILYELNLVPRSLAVDPNQLPNPSTNGANSMSQQFDPMTFLDAETDEASVKRPPIPVGDYPGVVKELKPTPWQSKDLSKSGMKFEVMLTVDVPQSYRDEHGLDLTTISLRDSIMLDMTENGAIDYSVGKNAGLRRYREAVGMNKPGESFSPRKMEGRPVLVKVEHEIYNNEPVERVKGVAAI